MICCRYERATSISRFARNTVTLLETVRDLKERGIDVYFEEQNIHTESADGELMLTILASYAQEESRSVSENCKWRIRNDFKEGNPSNNIRIYGYDYKKGHLTVIPEEAEVVRMIFGDYLSGMGRNAIMKKLTRLGIPTKTGGRWPETTVSSILSNEKFVGDMMLQKTYCANFLTKKMVKNTGQVQQYYVDDSHPAIVDSDEWDAVQAEIERRKKRGSIGRCGSHFSGKIICGECGGFFAKKVWGSYKSDKTYRKEIYQCNEKYKHNGKGSRQCGTPVVTEDEAKERFLTAFNKLMENRDGLIEDCRMVQSTLCDTTAVDAEIADLRREIEVLAELSRKAICENARTAQNQTDFNERNNGYLERHRQATTRVDELEAEKRERLAKSKTLDIFIRDIEKRPLALTEWEEALWLAVVDKVTVAMDGTMTFTFRNGAEVTA